MTGNPSSLPTGNHDESARLQALREYRILDTENEEIFDNITRLASQICEVPISLISLIDKDRQWFKSRYGLKQMQTDRSIAVCDHAIREPGKTFLVPDLGADSRFQNNPLVTGDPHLAFYAGYPLVDGRGFALGTLCVIDHQPRTLRPDQEFALRTLAQTVVTLLEQRRKNFLFNYFYDNLGDLMNFSCPYYLFLSASGRILRFGKNYLINIPDLQEDSVFTDVFEWEQVVDLRAELAKPAEAPNRLVFFHLKNSKLRFKGGFRVFDDFLLLLASPVINSQNTIKDFGITLDDFPRHDYISEYIFLHQTTQRSLNDAQVITAKLRAKNKDLHEAQKQIESISLFPAENPNPILRFDEGLKLVYSNNSATQFLQDFEITEEAIGEEELRLLMTTVRESGSHLSNRYLERKGRVYSVWVRFVPERQYVNVYANDITRYVLDLRQKETEVAAKNVELEGIRRDLEVALKKETELSQMKTGFISMTSHEFRTPLTTIQANAELLELHLGSNDSLTPQSTKFLKRISGEITRLTTLMNDILLMGRIESGRLPFQPASVDLPHLLVETLESAKSDAQETRVPVFEMEGQPVPVHVDAFLFNHIFTNLISNALKYSRGKPAPKVLLRFLLTYFEVHVIDYGIGIPKSEQSKAFESFFRASNVSNIHGTGLGLAITRQFVEMHGGEISIQSQEGEGTTVTVRFPLTQGQPEKRSTHQ